MRKLHLFLQAVKYPEICGEVGSEHKGFSGFAYRKRTELHCGHEHETLEAAEKCIKIKMRNLAKNQRIKIKSSKV